MQFFSFSNHSFINVPLWRIPIVNVVGCASEFLLYTVSPADTGNVWVNIPCIFIELTKKVLAINQLKRALPEIFEVQAALFEFVFRFFGHHSYNLCFLQSTQVFETLPDTIFRTRT